VLDELQEAHQRGQPVLVGTIAIETSEKLSGWLKKRGVPHNVLNAKQHEREAEIIAQAGRPGALTISTNMAGRGTDIVLGGNPEMLLRGRGLDPRAPENEGELERLRQQCEEQRGKVLEAGGLHVVGTERHESRRIDNQLRGRSGRQGDPGSSRFFLSLEDHLLRVFGSDRIKNLMGRLGMQEGESLEMGLLSRQIERAQGKVEARNFDIRKHLLEYDDVMNQQRESIYGWRRRVLGSQDLRAEFLELAHQLGDEILETTLPERGERDPQALARELERQFAVALDPALLEQLTTGRELDRERVRETVTALLEAKLDEKIGLLRDIQQRRTDLLVPSFDDIGRGLLLQILDQQWKDHLLAMDHLRDSVGLRGYGGQDPKREYQKEGFRLFSEMNYRIGSRAVEQMWHVVFHEPSEQSLRAQRAAEEARRRRAEALLREQHAGEREPEKPEPVRRAAAKVGRNEPCPCGSGKKFKKCCGAAA
jgi:preprotein translocase subunit SecA